LPDAAVPYALACLVIHEVDDPLAFFQEVKRILQPDGHFYIIEWTRQENSKMGPPLEHRIDGTALVAVLKQSGFHDIEHFELNSEMYAIIVKK